MPTLFGVLSPKLPSPDQPSSLSNLDEPQDCLHLILAAYPPLVSLMGFKKKKTLLGGPAHTKPGAGSEPDFGHQPTPLVTRGPLLTSSSLYQDRFSAVSTNQYSLEPPFIMPILLMVSQPFRMTWRVRGRRSVGRDQASPRRMGSEKKALESPPLPQLLETWPIREGRGQTCPGLNHK